MASLRELVSNRYFAIFFLVWLGNSFGLTHYEPERRLLSQLFIFLFYAAQFLLIYFFVKPGIAIAAVASPEAKESPVWRVKTARGETLFLLAAYLVFMAIQLTLMRQQYLERRTFEVMRIYWVFYVMIPALYFHFLGYKPSDLGITAARFKAALRSAAYAALIVIPFLLVASNSAMFIWKGHLPIVKIFLGIIMAVVYGFFSAGLFEEFFFRALLQTRLESLLRSEAGGLFLSSILFGLYHLPSRMIMTNGDIGHSFCMVLSAQMLISPILGLLWLRTRNLMVPVIIHSLMDGLSGFSGIGKAFGIF